MREILFRGKSLDTGEWVYGYFAKAHWYTGDCDMTIIIPMDSTLYPRSEISSYEFVDPETVGQWTGLTDTNGVKIFEGDVLESPVKRVGQKYGTLIAVSDIRECKDIALYVNEYEVMCTVPSIQNCCKGVNRDE